MVDDEVSESDRVEAWRMRSLKRAHVSGPVALVLARSLADLHVMIAAAEHGCPEDMLLLIFADPDPVDT